MTENMVVAKARHASTTHTRRNSSIELLRIIAMVMILSHHFVLHNGSRLSAFPLAPAREVFSFFFLNGGKIGVVIFFSISTWFLISSEQSIKKNFTHIWLMERELLFWSLTLLMVFVCIRRSPLSPVTTLSSFLPVITNLWWYATAYVMFLAVLPFLQYALRTMGRKRHCQLALMLLLALGPLSMLPLSIFSLFTINVFGFIYIFIVLSCYKLYLKKLNNKQLWIILVAGLAIGVLGYLVKYGAMLCTSGTMRTAISDKYTPFIDFSLPALMIGIPMFLLFNHMHFYNKPINFIAKSAFAVYLISEYPAMRNWLWINVFDLKTIYYKPFMPLYVIGILLAVYAGCTLCDFIRRGLFALTVDRHPGRWFDALWNKVAHWSWVQSLPKLMNDYPTETKALNSLE
ncbi:acyltransferase family protein [Bifidobacterium criceti]|uniref:Symporter n=1 Tax=Bifidobacterium criceti TaxID=1960969 RepID=A0A2A2EJ78_9BIFI|nr:acyltransferase [Bifidobacterium criceti]PAU68985.1 symporter [Bifidobacterium criceti]